jgi:hypothetical protein
MLRVLCNMVKHYKIKNMLCIHEDQQFDCMHQRKRAYEWSQCWFHKRNLRFQAMSNIRHWKI